MVEPVEPRRAVGDVGFDFGQFDQDVHAETQSLDAWVHDARSAGLGEEQIDDLVKMFQYYEGYNFKGNTRVLKGLLGREPTTLHEVITREITQRHTG